MPADRQCVRGLAVLMVACLTASILGSVQSASASACGSLAVGSGTAIDPWQIRNNDELMCLQAGWVWFAPGGAHFVQTADLEYDSAIPLVQPHLKMYDGNNHSITIMNVHGFPGLFGDTAGASISNIVIKIVNSSTDLEAGWLANQDVGSTFSNIVVNAPVSSDGGGIVGAGSEDTDIRRSVSTGVISVNGGGLVGKNSQRVTITESFSTGSISSGGGGLIGSAAEDFTISRSFSTGHINNSGGGLVGAGSIGGRVSNSYSNGIIGNNGGGILNPSVSPGAVLVGYVTNSYSTGIKGSYAYAISGELSPTERVVSINASYGALGSWSDSSANTNLTGVPSGAGSIGTSWGTCGINLPYFIAAFYSTNPCVSALATDVEVSGTDSSLALSRSSIDGPSDNSFSLTSTVGSSPFSYVSLVNGTGSVSLGGTSCTQASDCQIRDVVQGPFSRGSFTITGDGTVSVKRFNSFTGDSSTVGTLSVSRIRSATPEVARHIVTLNSNGGTCSANSLSVVAGSSVVIPTSESCAKAGHTFAGWLDENGSRVLTKELVVTGDRTLSASWIVEVAKPSVLVRNRITARISRLASDAQVVRVRGQVVGATKASDLQVWFKEKGMKAFVKSSEPIVRKGRQFTWFHYTGNAILVYVAANGSEQSRTLRISALPNGG